MLLDIDININKETAAQFARNFRAYQKRETIPIIAEISNLFDGALLLYSCFSSAEGSAVQNVRRSYVQQKGVLRFALLLIPIVGSLLVSVWNFFNPEYIETGCYKALMREDLLSLYHLEDSHVEPEMLRPVVYGILSSEVEKILNETRTNFRNSSDVFLRKKTLILVNSKIGTQVTALRTIVNEELMAVANDSLRKMSGLSASAL